MAGVRLDRWWSEWRRNESGERKLGEVRWEERKEEEKKKRKKEKKNKWVGFDSCLIRVWFGFGYPNLYPIDKGQICIKANPIYLVFCVVYHLFWTFWCVCSCCRWCSSKIIKKWSKDSKNEQKRARIGYVQEHAAAWLFHACADFRVQYKNQRGACRGMAHSCRNMPYPCRGMRTFDSLGYFWTLG